MAGDVVQVGVDLRAHAFVEGADGAGHLHLVGDDVVADAAVELAEADHRRLVGQVAAAADHGLRAADQVGGGDDRVHPAPWTRAMGLAPLHGDGEAVGGGHQRASAHRDGADRQ